MRILAVIVALGLLVLSSCCPKCDCIGGDTGITFRVSGFTSTELQTFMVKRYERNTSLTAFIDSFEVQPLFEPGTDSLLIFPRLLDERLIERYDYVLHNDSVATNILLNNLSVEYHEGKGCCKCPRYNLKRYTVNNIHQYPENGTFRITR